VENESRQPWTLIAIAGLGLVLGVIALVLAASAKNTADDAATQQSVEEVSTKLSNLVDKLGIAEQSLTGEQEELRGTARREARESRSAVVNLSNRLQKLERQTDELNAATKRNASLGKQTAKEVASLETQIATIDSRITAVNQRVTNLTRRVDDESGDQSAP